MKHRLSDWTARIAIWSFLLFILYAVFRACTGLGPLWLLWVFPAISLIMVLILGSSNTRAAKAASQPLDDECDPEPLLTFSKTMYEKAGPTTGSVTHRVNYAIALSLLGRKKEAEKSMQETAILLPQNEQDENKIYYRLHELNMHLFHMAAAEFEQRLEALRDVVERAKLIAVKKTQFLQIVTELNYDFQITNGAVDDKLESDMRLSLVKSATLYDRVRYHVRLGRYYKRKGDTTGARPHWEFVAENGNKLAVRAEAEEMLKSM